MTWQRAAIEFPDAELVMCDRTRTLLADPTIYVGNTIPNPRVAKMVVWNRDGGPTGALRDQPRMRGRVWAETDEEANDLARKIVTYLPTFIDGNPILAVDPDVTGPVDVPDSSGQPQKYLLVNIHTRGVQK